MNCTSGDLINSALQRSFSQKCNKGQVGSLSVDDHIVANARRILSTKIDYVSSNEYSTSAFLENLKKKYIVLKPKNKKRLKKRKKKSKNKNSADDSALQMKNTELSGQNLTLPAPKTVLFSPDAVQLGWKSTVPVGSGFVNLGTTCYINSTLQALFHVPSFVNWLLDDKKHHTACEKMNGIHHTECIVCAMSKTLLGTHKQTGSSFRPRNIIEKVKSICKHLSPFRQEDAHEFLRYLMEAMEKSYTVGLQIKKLDNYSKETTPLNQIFGGYIRTEVTCLECNEISTTFQHFQDLILDIRQASTTTVYDALENYFSKERLDGDESYHCEHCKKKVSAYKKFSVEKAPNALCIQLKRFNINSFYGGSKISKVINIPQNIDLSKYKHKKGLSNGTPLKYKLVSMVFHHGPSANSGHYTALGCTSSGSYYYFNDEQVYPVHLGQYTNNPNAYIMFYELESSLGTKETSPVKNSLSSSSASSSTCSVSPIPNGYVNGTVQRSNGFFIKRETSFTTSSNHSKPPSWDPTNCESKPASAPVTTTTTTAAANSTTALIPATSKLATSLVPYKTSDSDSSDSESEPVTTTARMNGNSNHNNSSSSSSSSLSVSNGNTPSPLAKKNSTLTSLLTSSSKNENSTYHATTPTKSPSRPQENGEKEQTSISKTIETKPEKRGFIAFSFHNRDKKNENGDHMKNGNSGKQAIASVSPMYKKKAEEKASEKICNGNGVNGVKNGMVKNGATVNGSSKVETNGWIVTEMDEEHSPSRTEESNGKSSPTKMPRGDWMVVRTVTEKENRNGNFLHSKDLRNGENRENGKKYDSGNKDSKNDSSLTANNNSTAVSNHFSHSSYNGYGSKVYTWNGEMSYISKETEKERKESTKRSYSQSYDDDLDRGKIKKLKYHNRNDNGSSSQVPRKNPIQQYHNNYNRMNGRPPWHNQNGHHYNNSRRFATNGYYRYGYGCNNRNYGYSQQNWRR